MESYEVKNQYQLIIGHIWGRGVSKSFPFIEKRLLGIDDFFFVNISAICKINLRLKLISCEESEIARK